MANAFFIQGRVDAIDGDLNFDTQAYRFNLMDTGYVVNLSTQLDVADISSDFISTNPNAANLSSKTSTNGVADAADQTPAFTGPNNGGSAADYLVLAMNTGTPANDHLLLYIDTAAAGLPVTPNGGNLNLSFNASGIFTLGQTS